MSLKTIIKSRSLKISLAVSFLSLMLYAYFSIFGIWQHFESKTNPRAWEFTYESFAKTVVPGQSHIIEVIPKIIGKQTHAYNDYEIHFYVPNEATHHAPPNFKEENFFSFDENRFFVNLLNGCPESEIKKKNFYEESACTLDIATAWNNFRKNIQKKIQAIRLHDPATAKFLEENLVINVMYTTVREWKPYGGWIWPDRSQEFRSFDLIFNIQREVVNAEFNDSRLKLKNSLFYVPG
jgi:hypothetical protein